MTNEQRVELLRRSGGRFSVREEVASSDGNRVLLVWDAVLRRARHVTTVCPGLSDEMRALAEWRLVRHARCLGRFEHPGLPPVHELGIDEELGVYFVTPPARGTSLAALTAGSDASPARCIELLARACEAVAHAHARGVVHGALRGTAIQVGSFGEVAVVDWRQATLCDEDVDGVDVRTDVRALGAFLAELLDAPAAAMIASHADLRSIATKACATDDRACYGSVSALGRDLRAWLDARVVAAHGGGAWYGLRTWARRNARFATTLGVALVLIVVGLALTTWLQKRANDRLARAADALATAEQSARAETDRAQRGRDEILSLADARRLSDLTRRAESLWPARAALIPDYERWLEEARALALRLPVHRAHLSAVRARSAPESAEDRALAQRRLEYEVDFGRQLREFERLRDMTGDNGNLADPDYWRRMHESMLRVAALEAARPPEGALRFPDPADEWLYELLAQLCRDLERFLHPATGLIVDVQARLAEASVVATRTAVGSNRRWDAAIRSIADRAVCPQYAGLVVTPQLGLLPLRRHPASGLWEFWLIDSGLEPELDRFGQWKLEPWSGLVFVLLPGGHVGIGAQRSDPSAPHYDPGAWPDERPVFEVELSPFFCSAYEVTRDQWRRWTGAMHHENAVGPAEEIDWRDAVRVLARYGLQLPTEVQWEYASRGGTTTPWWCGTDHRVLTDCANLADSTLNSASPSKYRVESRNDGLSLFDSVATQHANGFGLYQVAGSVSEWCRDSYGSYRLPHRAGDGLCADSGDERRVIRGGNALTTVATARSAYRQARPPDYAHVWLGVRPVRPVE